MSHSLGDIVTSELTDPDGTVYDAAGLVIRVRPDGSADVRVFGSAGRDAFVTIDAPPEPEPDQTTAAAAPVPVPAAAAAVPPAVAPPAAPSAF